ncbi:hypothetical protein LUW74_28500 [Actinomadura madurae]|uniref:LysM peptidoglycan-binding domain-containing protein n=1 Tax=Actinomadura madurae TaxID=1993 RepID=UPI00202676B9|nr:hypothetical protein [Actinomadura madurae]URN06867.1 hypothetical protein LUW74_28500 [Actinomadura madurae]
MRGRRSAGDVMAGIGALVALAALMAGVPFALLTLFGSPLPDQVPSASDLTHRVGPGSLIAILVALVWLAWLQLAACVAVEVYAGVRGVGVPARVPLAGGTQSLVHRLVVAALLLFTATTAIMPAFSGGGLSQRQPAVQMQPQAQTFHRVPDAPERPAAAERLAEELTADPAEKSATTKIYRVQPPEGRHHESLWEIAEKCLGEGRRYKEIYSLNKGHIQPDGTRLTIASLIRPGWILEMPADAKGAKVIPKKDLDDYFRYGHAVPDRPEKPKPPEKPARPAPPTAQPTQPPASQAPPATPKPPESQPPASQPPASQPPASQPPASQPPASQPPASQAPPATSQPPASPTPAPRPSEPRNQEAPHPPVHGGTEGPSGEMGGAAGSGGAEVPGKGSPAVRGDRRRARPRLAAGPRRGVAARRRAARRARPAPPHPDVAPRVRAHGRPAGGRGGRGRAGAADRRRRRRGEAARPRAAAHVEVHGGGRPGHADRLRRAPRAAAGRARQPRPVDRARRPEPARALAGLRRRPGVAAERRRAARAGGVRPR